VPSQGTDSSILSSWKEIADYLGVTDRTCRRWELTLRLPIHRMEGKTRSRTYAYKEELDVWRKTKLIGNPAANENLGDAHKSWRARSRLARTRNAYILLIATSVVVLAVAVFIFRSLPGQPSDFSINGSKLIILDQKGKKLWDFDTGVEKLWPEQRYRRRFQIRASSPEGRPWLPYIVIKDINVDGKVEVLFTVKTIDEYDEGILYCFSKNGQKLWQFSAGEKLQFGKQEYSADYRIYGLDTVDLDNNGDHEIIILARQAIHSPTELIVLDAKGKNLGSFVNWGSFVDIACIDLDADGKKEVMIAGENDEYGEGFLAVFDSTKIKGASPQTEKYACRNCDPGSERYYILFPRTDVDRILAPDKEGIDEIRFLKDDRIQLLMSRSRIYYELDFDLHVLEVKGSDYFRGQHREFFAAGKISSNLDDSYYESLRKRVLYWTGREWTPTPSINSNRWNANRE
jgi:hypothetical protein